MTNTGDKYFDSEAFHKLLDSYETSINAGEPVFMDADDLVDIADYYQYTGEKDKAEEAISLALSLSPGSSSPLTYRIHEALFQQNDPQKAWELLEQMIDKESPDYIFDRAEILISEGNIEEAEEYLEENFRDLPSDEQQDFIVDAANIFMDWRLPEKVIQWVTRGNPNDPNVKNSTEFKEILAKAFVEMGKYEDGKRIFNELIDKDPFSKKYWNALASAQFMNEDYSGAIQSSEYAIALEPEDPEGFITKANGLLRLNNFEEALKYYQRYLELEPDDEFALLHEGTCLINMLKLQEAIEVLKKAQAITTKDSSYFWDIYQELAFAYAENKEPDKALEVMDQAEAMEYDLVQILLIRGHIFLNAEKLDEAKEAFGKAIRMSDSRKQTLLRVIVSFYDNRYVQGAYAFLQRFLTHYDEEEEGKNTEGYAYMALCCYELKKYDEFLSYLKKACEVNPAECRIAVGNMFPEDVKPEDYYQYVKDKLDRE